MDKQEFLKLARNNIKGSIHEGYLYTEAQQLLQIVEKYNETFNILSMQHVPMFNDNRYIEIIDSMQERHGLIFIDKDQLSFSFNMDNYVLSMDITNLGNYYKKDVEYIEAFPVFDDEAMWNNAPDEVKLINNNNGFIQTKQLKSRQMFGNSENMYMADITTYNMETNEFLKTNFEYDKLGANKTHISVDRSDKNHKVKYISNLIKLPNNNIECVSNNEYGYSINFGLESFIDALNQRDFKKLGCKSLDYFTVRRPLKLDDLQQEEMF